MEWVYVVYEVFLEMLEVMVDEVFGLGFLDLTEDVYEKEVFFSSAWIWAFWLKIGSFGTSSLSSFIVVTNTLEIIVQTFAILFNPWLIKIFITSSNNIWQCLLRIK